MDGIVLTPNPYTESVNKKRLSSGSNTDLGNTADNGSRTSVPRSPSYINNGTSKLSLRSSRGSLYHHYSQDLKPENGCLLLGQHGTSGNKYTTRFRVDSATERKNASEGVFLEECCLCSEEENRSTLLKCLLAIVMSEAFLLTFHLGALALGVIKTCINREKIDDDLELIHSIVEILAVTFVLFARVMLVRNGAKDIKKYKTKHQHYDIGESETSIVGKHIRTIVISFTILCVIFDLIAIGCFLLFYYLVHLGWTTLVNNVILIIATVLSNISLTKLGKVKSAIVEDEHKIVLYEAALLLKEGNSAFTEEERKAHNDKVMRFIKSLMDTDSFYQPSHIQLADKYAPRWNTVTTMELISAI